MKAIPCATLCWVLMMLAAVPALVTKGTRPEVTMELIEPFEFTYNSESPVMFVRITNTSGKPLRVACYDDGNGSDLQFENAPPPSGESSEFVPLWSKRFLYVKNQPKPEGLTLNPGETLVLSEHDTMDMDFNMYHWEFGRIRPHFRVRTGEWIAGDWYDRKILPDPVLSEAKSLFDYTTGGGQTHSVVALPANGETWLFSCSLASSFKNLVGARGQIDMRMCRLPDGRLPVSIAHDENENYMTIRFGGGEEYVVINTRTGMPVNGSEKTVPHLHLWLKLAGRPFSDALRKWLGKPKPMPPGASVLPQQPALPEKLAAAVSVGRAPEPESPPDGGSWKWIAVTIMGVLSAATAAALWTKRKCQGASPEAGQP